MKNEKISRILEVQLGHPIVKGKHNQAVIRALRDEGRHKIAEQLRSLTQQPINSALYDHKTWQAIKQGKPVDIARAIIVDAWRRTNYGNSFKQVLAESGLHVEMGKKALVVTDEHGDSIPLLRALNSARTQSGLKRVKKAELDARLSQAPVSKLPTRRCKPIKNNTSHKANSYPLVGSLRSVVSAATKPAWFNRRQQQFKNAYRTEVSTELIRYWRFAYDQNGQIWLNNKHGAVIDKGNTIETRSDSSNLKACAEATVTLALTKGWNSAKVTGNNTYKSAVMQAAYRNGLDIDLTDPEDQQLWDQMCAKHKQRAENDTKPAVDTSHQGPKMG